MRVGVLALQGAFREHREALGAVGVEAPEVRTPAQLAGVDALVLPGGESTVVAKLLASSGLLVPIRDRLEAGLPALGTCAGLILLATRVLDGRPDQATLGVLDLCVRRNAYGVQRESFEAPVVVTGLDAPFPGVFIRAPIVEAVGAGVETLGTYDGRPVLCRQGAVWASTFHPELSGDLRIHERFVNQLRADGIRADQEVTA